MLSIHHIKQTITKLLAASVEILNIIIKNKIEVYTYCKKNGHDFNSKRL